MADTILYGARSPVNGNLTAKGALDFILPAKGGEQAVGLFYTPFRCFVTRIDAAGIHCPDENRVPIEAAYELRVFNTIAELRWIQEAGGRGAASIITEKADAIPAGWSAATPRSCEVHSVEYLAWGETTVKAGSSSGWSTLSTGRIGDLALPVELGEGSGKRIVVKAVEYFAEGDEDGNLVVIEERLLGLGLFVPRQQRSV